MKLKQDLEYRAFVEDIKKRVRASQYEALRAVNKELIALYWDIGQRIVEKQKKLGWGKAVVESLAVDLQKEFPGMQGFSARNIWYMRNFYLLYADNAKLQPLVAEIGWTRNVVIMDRCKESAEREFYVNKNPRDAYPILKNPRDAYPILYLVSKNLQYFPPEERGIIPRYSKTDKKLDIANLMKRGIK